VPASRIFFMARSSCWRQGDSCLLYGRAIAVPPFAAGSAVL
jgi:hypothetical protein